MTMTAEAVFSEYARYYDLLYRDKDYAGESRYIHNLIQRWMPGAATVLELGSGTGKHAALLADRGYAIHGVERSDEMLVRARCLVEERRRRDAQWPAPEFSQGDVRTVRLNRTFDVALSLFHVISYQTSNEDLLAALKTARVHVQAGGLLLFDVWYGPTVLSDRPTVRVKRMTDHEIEVTRLAEPAMHPNENLVDVNYHVFIRDRATGQVSETRETHTMRYLFLPELAEYLRQSHFTLRHSEEWMSGRRPGFDTWGVCIAATAL